MAEATLQQITTSLPGEEPFIGDLDEGEMFINVADGRVWSGDSIGTPIELGGAVKNCPMGPLLTSNYLDVDVTSADNLPIANTNPLDIPAGFYREQRILLRFTQNPLQNFSTYFDYPVNWGVDASWKFGTSVITWGGNTDQLNFEADNPIDFYKGQGRKVLIELSSFGPSSEWIGRLLWVSTPSEI
jgi:hypothetical protein